MFLTGCAQTPTSSVTLPSSFATDAKITVDDTVYGAYISRFAGGYWQIELKEPAAVKGLIFTVSGEDTEVSFDGLRFTFDTDKFPVGSVVAAAIDSLDRILASPVDVINGEESCLATGTIGNETYALTMSKTHIPQRLELTECKMTIDFYTFDTIEVTEQ